MTALGQVAEVAKVVEAGGKATDAGGWPFVVLAIVVIFCGTIIILGRIFAKEISGSIRQLVAVIEGLRSDLNMRGDGDRPDDQPPTRRRMNSRP